MNKKKSSPTQKTTGQPSNTKSDMACIQCRKTGHQPSDCRYKKKARCHFCEKIGHLAAVSKKKKDINTKKPVGHIVDTPIQAVVHIRDCGDRLPVIQPLQMNEGTQLSSRHWLKDYWMKFGKLPLQPTRYHYISATRQDLPVLRVLKASATITD